VGPCGYEAECRALIRMRSQVQVLAGPPTITAGYSAVGGKPGALAASLGRAGAARPSPPARPSALPAPPIRAAGPTTTTHRGRHPAQDGSYAAAAAPSRWRLVPCPPPSRKRRRSARRPGLPGRSAGHARPPAVTPPGPGSPPTPLTTRSRQHRPRPGLLGVHRAAPRRGSPPGLDPFCGDGCPPARPGPHRRLRWDEMDASGRTEADSSRLDTGRAGHRTGWTPDGLDTDGWTPDSRTPDGLDTGCTGHQTAGHWTAGPPDRTTQPLRDTTWWTRTGDRRHGRHPGLGDHGGNARPLGSGWTLRRAAAVWATNQPGPRSSKDYEDGPGHRRDGQLQVPRRRPAGASAHCCPRTSSGRA
jgi:hypothetical protein